MSLSPQRRRFLLAAAAAPFVGGCAPTIDLSLPEAPVAPVVAPAPPQARFAALEQAAGGRLGVAAVNQGTGARLDYRAGERFPFCSTAKVLVVAAILKRSERENGLLQRRIQYTKADLVSYSPVSGPRVAGGMTVTELCDAAIRYSDNSAANLLIKVLGGPAAVTAFARGIGDQDFRLDRWETALNTAVPGDPRDTSTPQAMMRSLQVLLLTNTLAAPQRKLLQDWMLANTTGDERIRAGVPAGWGVADKTGTGDYGSTNDLAVVWPPRREAIVLAVYFTQPAQDAKARSDVIANATRLVVELLR